MLGLFSFFSFFLILGAIGVVFSRNTVHAVLALIFAFFNGSALLIMIGAEFVGFMLVVVYVGAVAVLFLFVVMMLDVDRDALTEKIKPSFRIIKTLLAVVFFEAMILVFYQPSGSSKIFGALTPSDGNNVRDIGMVLYTQYAPMFYTSGMILLLAMIGAITLTLRKRSGVKKQVISKQNQRSARDAVILVTPNSGEGIAK